MRANFLLTSEADYLATLTPELQQEAAALKRQQAAAAPVAVAPKPTAGYCYSYIFVLITTYI